MDFVSDALADDRRFRRLTVVDDATRECVLFEVERSLPVERVIAALDRVACLRGYARHVTCGNEPALRSEAMNQRADQHSSTEALIEPGRPVKSALIESFNGLFRDEH